MFKKLLFFSIIFIFSFLLFNVSHATDIVNTNTTEISNNISDSDSLNTYITDTTNTENSTDTSTIADSSASEEPPTTIVTTTPATTTDYDNSTDLSISNIINIILISVGIVLILLGIAIIIKLK